MRIVALGGGVGGGGPVPSRHALAHALPDSFPDGLSLVFPDIRPHHLTYASAHFLPYRVRGGQHD